MLYPIMEELTSLPICEMHVFLEKKAARKTSSLDDPITYGIFILE